MTTSVSTMGLLSAPRMSTMRSERSLREAQIEVSSGRHADVGLELGADTGQTLRLRSAKVEIETINKTNGMILGRLDLSQDVLETVSKDAQAFVGDLFAMRPGAGDRQLMITSGKERLSALGGLLNATYDGVHIFGGINSGDAPFKDYFSDPTSDGRNAVIAAFTTEFGFPPDDPAVSSISSDDMKSFLQGAFADLFEEPSWSTNFSNASDKNRVDRVSPFETASTSISAQEEPFRKLASAYIAATEFGVKALGAESYRTLVDFSIATANDALNGITAGRARLGLTQERINNAQESMTSQLTVLERGITSLEGVDAYEAATRMTTLMNQIEASYAVTARLQKLTLLNYL